METAARVASSIVSQSLFCIGVNVVLGAMALREIARALIIGQHDEDVWATGFCRVPGETWEPEQAQHQQGGATSGHVE